MTSIRETSLTILAGKMMLTPKQAVALPSVITKAASSLGFAEERMIEESMGNARVGEYLASICRTVTK